MSSNLPIPSKSALRALRHLALGTSCTVAFSAGLLTEDRRRRIHAAREVNENAQRLKSLPNYRGAGSASIESFGQANRYWNDPSWMVEAGSKKTQIHRDNGITSGETPDRSRPSQSPKPRFSFHMSTSPLILPKKIISKISVLVPPDPTIVTQSRKPPNPPKQQLHNRQNKLASDVTKLLLDHEDVDAAAGRFFDAFEEIISVDDFGVIPGLFDAAVELSNALTTQSNFESASKVFEVISRQGPMEEEQFYRFWPEKIIEELISCLPKNGERLKEALERTSAIFLTKLREKPKLESQRMQALGDRLCEEAVQAYMWDLALDVYHRRQQFPGSKPHEAVHHLIRAAYHKRQPRKIVRYFKKFYSQTSPSQLQFLATVSMVIDSTLQAKKENLAEEVLVIASRMAEEKALLMSTTWLLKVIGNDWRTYQDLSRTRLLFDRLEPLHRFVSHPQAVYGAMIQFCVEAHKESLGISYYEKLREHIEPDPGDVRIYGHFALAKAMRNDWDGVLEDLRKMKQLNPDDDAEFAGSFGPILKRFTESHTANEAEEFLLLCIDQYHLQLTTTIMNTMVNAYARHKEIDSLANWLIFSSKFGCPIDAVTFNTILHSCFRSWRFSFDDVYNLYMSVKKLPGSSKFLNQTTISTLRGIVVSREPHLDHVKNRLKKLDRRSSELHDKQFYRLNGLSVYQAMARHFAKGELVATLNIYQRSHANKIPLKSAHVIVAVRASLQLHKGDMTMVKTIIRNAREAGRDTDKAIAVVFQQHLRDLDSDTSLDTNSVIELARDAMVAFAESGINVRPGVVAHTTDFLTTQGRYLEAIQLWDNMSRRLKFSSSSYDLPILTSLLKTYIGLRDPVGVSWIVKILAANKIVPDGRFRLLLKTTRRRITLILESTQASDKMYRFLDAIIDTINWTKMVRQEWMLDKKAVRLKTIDIVRTAIDDAGRRQDSMQSVNLQTQVNEGWLEPKDREGGHTHVSVNHMDEDWLDSEDEAEDNRTVAVGHG